MANSLSELSKTYEKSIALQQEIIERYRQRLNRAKTELNFKEMQRLTTLIKMLNDEKKDLEVSAYELKKYLS